MLAIFRSMLKSKVGALIAVAILIVIAVAFASGDIAGLRSSSGLGGSDAVAMVGSTKIDAEQLSQGANQALNRVKQEQPSATMKLLVAQGGIEQVLDDLIDRAAVLAYGKDHGVVISDRLIDSEIAKIPAFQGMDGKFDQNTFRQALAQQGISQQALRDDIAKSMSAELLLAPAQFGSVMSDFAAKRYAALLTETRSGTVASLPALLFAPQREPTVQELGAFYKAHTSQFIRPERRIVRYAAFDESAMKPPAAPTDAEIAARFAANKAQFAAQDNRKITQLIVPTEAAAKAVVAEVQGGKSLEAAAKEKGLTAAALEYFSRQQLSSQFSPAVADAVFAAPVGKLATPQKSALGWSVIRVDEVQQKPAKTLAEVKDQLTQEILEAKRRSAFTDMLAKIEDQFADGASLSEVAKAIGAQVQQTPPVTADGGIYMKPGESAPDLVKPVLQTAFGMDQEEPQVAEVVRGKTFLLYDVTDIAASAPAPLAEITADVKLAWALDAGSKAARDAAVKMQAAIRKGQSLEQAMAGTGKQLPPIQQVSMSRATLTQALRQGKQVPPPVALMFHMAKGTVKVQSAAGDRGWFVVQLKDIAAPPVDAPELVSGARKELGGQLGKAYSDALTQAILKEEKVTRNPKAIQAVKDKLGGAGIPADGAN